MKKAILESSVFSSADSTQPGKVLTGEAWEAQILVNCNYDLATLKEKAAEKMKGKGGRL